ncbi:MAG: hypothetical protein RR571_09305, partial [Anaerorhabdus sp.]
CDGKMNFEAGKMRHGINGRFRYGKKICRKSLSYTFGTIIYNKHISLQKFFDLLWSFCDECSNKKIKDEALVNKNTVSYWKNLFITLICETGQNFNVNKLDPLIIL